MSESSLNNETKPVKPALRGICSIKSMDYPWKLDNSLTLKQIYLQFGFFSCISYKNWITFMLNGTNPLH